MTFISFLSSQCIYYKKWRKGCLMWQMMAVFDVILNCICGTVFVWLCYNLEMYLYSPSVEVCTELSWWARRFAWDWRIRDCRHQEGRNGDSGDRGDRGRGARPGDAPHTMGVIPYPWAWLSIRVLLILSWRLILTESAVRSVWAVSISLV